MTSIMEEEKQTQTSEHVESAGEQEAQTTDDTEAEAAVDSQTTEKKEEVDYRVKFSESSREALRLLDEKKALEQSISERDQKISAYEKQLESLKADNPDLAKVIDLENTVNELKKDAALGKEERSLNEFIKEVPDAESFKEAIRKLGRIEPTKSYKEIFSEHFSAVVGKISDDVARQNSQQVETGKGSISTDPDSTLDAKEFNKLPLEKRRDIFKKMGL